MVVYQTWCQTCLERPKNSVENEHPDGSENGASDLVENEVKLDDLENGQSNVKDKKNESEKLQLEVLTIDGTDVSEKCELNCTETEIVEGGQKVLRKC